MNRRMLLIFAALVILIAITPDAAFAMHISEGFLPLGWCIFWFACCVPFFIWGYKSVKRLVADNPQYKMLLGVGGAFAFVLSALKLPSIAGSSSHPTGIGLGAIMFGPGPMSIIGCIVLLFQALLLAHGGIFTLGANTFSMAIVGSLTAYYLYKACIRMKLSFGVAVFTAACFADLATYLTTSLQLALAHPDPAGGIMAAFVKFLAVFAVTQLPLAVVEGILTVVVFNLLKTHNKQELMELSVLSER